MTALPVFNRVDGLGGGNVWITILFVVSVLNEAARAGLWIFAVVAGLGLLALSMAFIRRHRRCREDLAMERRRAADSPWWVSVTQAMAESRRSWLPVDVHDSWQRLRQSGAPPVLLDELLEPAFRSFRRAEGLLEPEPIHQSMRGAALLVAMLVFCGWRSSFRFGPEWMAVWPSLVFWIVAIWYAARIPALRNRLPGLRRESALPIAGPGWLRDRTRRWTIGDSTAIVFRTAHRKPGVLIRFIGPQGLCDMQFASPRDPDLLLLWERWTHPHPRLELEA